MAALGSGAQQAHRCAPNVRLPACTVPKSQTLASIQPSLASVRVALIVRPLSAVSRAPGCIASVGRPLPLPLAALLRPRLRLSTQASAPSVMASVPVGAIAASRWRLGPKPSPSAKPLSMRPLELTAAGWAAANSAAIACQCSLGRVYPADRATASVSGADGSAT